MAAIYCCGQENRRALLRANVGMSGKPLLNAIDYLVVAESGSLTVQFLTDLAAGLTWAASNFSIQGGLRGSTIPVTAVATGTTSITLTTGPVQDPGQYTLRVIPSDDSSFDLYLLSIDFSFQTNTITNVDCAATSAATAPATSEPTIDYLAKDYFSLRRLMLDRLASLSTEFQDSNAAELSTVLVELLAYAADQLSYYQDAVGTEAYLGTARRRVSVRRHARLLDYLMHEGNNARALVCVQVASGSTVSLPATQTWFLSRCGSLPMALAQSGTSPPTALLDELRLQYNAAVFEPLLDTTLRGAHNVMSFYTWGDAQCCLPVGATRATLVDSGLALAKDDLLILAEVKNPQSGRSDDVDPTHRYAVRLTKVTPTQDRLTRQNVVEIEWHTSDALPASLTLSTRIAGSAVSDVSQAFGNVVLVDHGQSIPLEPLIPAAPTSGLRYRPQLSRGPLTYHTDQSSAELATLPASRLLLQDAKAALPCVQLFDSSGNLWRASADLLHSSAEERKFVVEVSEEQQATLRFGDGTLGRAPAGSYLASYRVGNGTAGNVATDGIYHIIAPDLTALRGVRNLLPASGGQDPEPVSEVRLNAPQAFRIQERAITAEDFASLAQGYPDVQLAAGEWRFTGAGRTVFLAVLRRSGLAIDSAFKQGLREYLERFRLTGTEIVIVPATFVALDIALTVHLADEAGRGAVRDALVQLFSDVVLQSGQRGFFYPDNFGFGQSVYLGPVLATISQVPGVLWVDSSPTNPNNRFQRLGATRNELPTGKIAVGPGELARLGSIPGVASFGRIDFQLEGGL